MNVLVIGTGAAGSWQVRGEQLGGAMRARVTTAPAFLDWGWADAVVLVKRAARTWADTAHRYRVPIIWDALDFWPQPAANGHTEAEARRLLDAELRTIRPALVIGATEEMAQAAGGVYLPHHSRPGIVPTPARPDLQVVGYEGVPAYLGRWARAIMAACDERGWRFVMNPTNLADCDVLVAFRDGEWDGWMPRHWKSGVKLVNAIAAGRPIITQASAAWHEVRPCGTVIEEPADVAAALDDWADAGRRAAVVDGPRASAWTVDAMGARYRRLIAQVAKQGVSA